MKTSNGMLVGSFLSLSLIIFGMGIPKVEAKDYRILILPSGGATGIIPATLLAKLEERTGTPVYKLFDEIWGSSIGAITAALLTTPRNLMDDKILSSPTQGDVGAEPRSAAEVANFIEDTFLSCYRSANIRGIFSKLIGSSTRLKDTLIPIRILAAKVTDWWFGLMPKETEFVDFCQEKRGHLNLSEMVCASCTVPPVHRTQPVLLENGKYAHCLDAGHMFCGNQARMNPLGAFLKEFSQSIDLQNDTITIFFLGNGWVNLSATSYALRPLKLAVTSDARIQIFENSTEIDEFQGKKLIPARIFNIGVDLAPALEEWKETTLMGRMIKPFKNDAIDYNCAGIGFGPNLMMKKIAEDIAKDDRPDSTFQAMINYLMQSNSRLPN